MVRDADTPNTTVHTVELVRYDDPVIITSFITAALDTGVFSDPGGGRVYVVQPVTSST